MRSAETTTMSFPLGDNPTAFLIADVSGKGLGAALCTDHAAGRALRHDARHRSGQASSTTSIASSATTPRWAATQRCSSASSTLRATSNSSTPAILRPSDPQRKSAKLYTEGSFPVGLVAEAEFTPRASSSSPAIRSCSSAMAWSKPPIRRTSSSAFPGSVEVLMARTHDSLGRLQQAIFDAVANFRAARRSPTTSPCSSCAIEAGA